MTWLKPLLEHGFSKASHSAHDDEQTVVFAGDLLPCGDNPNEYEFGLYVPVEAAAVWQPAVTSNMEVVRQLKQMKAGQTFKITSEEPDGAVGIRINSIEISEGSPAYKIPAGSPPFFSL